MDEKNIWMFLFFAMLLICVVLAALQVRGTSNANYKKKYDVLKSSYVELAKSQSQILQEMMLKPNVLKENDPRYRDLEGALLEKKVRMDLGKLEAKVEELNSEK